MTRPRHGLAHGAAWVAVLVCACGARTALIVGDGGPLPRDLGASTDMPAPADMHVPRDMPSPRDMPEPVDMPLAIDAGPSTTCAGNSGPTSSTVCTTHVTMGMVMLSSATCFVDVRPMLGEAGTLTFDCDGGGALLVFTGGARFTGTATGTDIDVCTGTDFDYTDGCHWQSAQHITGSRLDGSFTLTYAEGPTSGMGCASACSATATITID